jgi:hypothetical protein
MLFEIDEYRRFVAFLINEELKTISFHVNFLLINGNLFLTISCPDGT